MLSNIAGNIQVVPGAADHIEVEALKHVWGPNAEQSKQRLGDATIESYATGNRVELRVEHNERKDARNVDVEFSVKVPADASVDLRTISGDIRVTNVKGEVRVQAVSGNVALEGTARLAAVKTVNGGITLTNTGSDAQLSLSTVNGDLQIQTLNARAVDVNTINGDVRIAGWSGDRAHVAIPRRRPRPADQPHQGRALRNRIALRRYQPVASRAARVRARGPYLQRPDSGSTSRFAARARFATTTEVRDRCAAPMAMAARACGCRRSTEI